MRSVIKLQLSENDKLKERNRKTEEDPKGFQIFTRTMNDQAASE